MSKNRLEAFSDGVFAIVVTLLVFNLHPAAHAHLGGFAMFRITWPGIPLYVLTFIITGMYWVSHHSMMHFIVRTDRTLLWLNLLLLLVIAFVPYPAALLIASHADFGGISVFAATLMLINIIGGCLWGYATFRHRLISDRVPSEFCRFVLKVHLSPVLFYGLTIVIAHWSRIGSLMLLAAVPAFFVLPNPWLERKINAAAAMARPHGSG